MEKDDKMGKEKMEEFDISLWVESQKEGYKKREEKRRAFLNSLIKKLIDYFKDREVKEVYIIGSILEEGNFYEFSDIDMAVRGLKDGYSKVYGDLEEIVERTIDLIELERCSFRDILKKRGLRII